MERKQNKRIDCDSVLTINRYSVEIPTFHLHIASGRFFICRSIQYLYWEQRFIDKDEELAKFKWVAIIAFIFLLSTYYAWQELKFAIWGKITEGRVTRVFETAGRRRRPLLAVEYTFKDDESKWHNERDDVSISWEIPENSVIVESLPGVPDSSRLEGHSNSLAVWIFPGLLYRPRGEIAVS